MTGQTKIYTIPAGCPFLDTLAGTLLSEYEDAPLDLAHVTLFLPTRRACKSMRESFLKISGGRTLLLPRLLPLGDIDEDELTLSFSGAGQEFLLRPSITALQRQLLLARLTGRLGRSRGLAQDLMLADALAKLLDQVYNEGLNLADLPKIIDNADFSEHWQISIDFLSILSEHWPSILEENGVMDAADRRNALLYGLADFWELRPPEKRIIAAGSAGSIPAVRRLLKTISALPDGCVILPGIDQEMDEESWDVLGDTHPQHALKIFLTDTGMPRHEVRQWKGCEDGKSRAATARSILAEIMRPAETSDKWQDLRVTAVPDFTALDIEQYECASVQEEALLIAVALRRTLEDSRKTACLVTPDRRLARRVAMACRRWGIEIDDSGGLPLSQTRAGLFARLSLCAVAENFRPVSLLSFCKHGLCRPSLENWDTSVRAMDRLLCRGPAPKEGLDFYEERLRSSDSEISGARSKPLQEMLGYLRKGFSPLTELDGRGSASLSDWCHAHVAVLEEFCPPGILWSHQDGEELSALLSSLQDSSGYCEDITLKDYAALFDHAADSVTIRPLYGQHPRLSILGQIESRLIEHDVMILGGLNEGTWPAMPAADPWMSRPMRKRFGLPPPERAIGIAAHDFAQSFCARKVILTRAVRVDGTPTVPSRWLQRMATVRKACGLDAPAHKGDLLALTRRLDVSDRVSPASRPAPRPAVAARPRRLSATQIETWIKDPYSIYAKKILRLEKLKPLEQPLDAAMRGTIIHAIAESFVRAVTDRELEDPAAASKLFMSLADRELGLLAVPQDVRFFWNARLLQMADWLRAAEREQRTAYRSVSEVKGKWSFDAKGGTFNISARADRIDIARDGTHGMIIDYKSGGTYSKSGMIAGRFPQLPLEALILEQGGFETLPALPSEALSYWILNGAGDGGKETTLGDSTQVAQAVLNAREGLQNLVDAFDRVETPYYSVPRADRPPPYSDYGHLARIREWSSLSDQEGDA